MNDATQSFLETHLSGRIREAMDIVYDLQNGVSPTARFSAFGCRMRLERDAAGEWTLTTDDEEREIIDRYDGARSFENWLLLAIANHTH